MWTSRSKAARNFAFLRAALLREVSLVPPLSHLHLMHRAQDSRVPLRSHPFILCTGHRIHDSLHSSSSLCTGHRIVQILPDHARLSYAQGKGFTSSAWSLPRSYAQGTGFTSSAPVFHPMHSAQDTLCASVVAKVVRRPRSEVSERHRAGSWVWVVAKSRLEIW